MADWQLYSRWNRAICETVFTDEHAGKPVYLDMDDSVLAEVADRVGVMPERAGKELAEAVRKTLVLNGLPRDVFQRHLEELAGWRKRVREARNGSVEVEPPPTVALLAVFTLAAEAMGSDDSVAAQAYYPRLAELLGVRGEEARGHLRHAYEKMSEQLWRSLNDWLTAADGRYGVPTAYALSHRYVGLALSQALVRAADRKSLAQLFRQFALPPGSNLALDDMKKMLDSWMQQVPCPASGNLRALWQRGSSRDRLAELVAAELLVWEGETAPGTSAQTGKAGGSVRLSAQLRGFPGRKKLQLSFLAEFPGGAQPDEIKLFDVSGESLVEALPSHTGAVSPRDASVVETRSMVEGVLRVADPNTGEIVTRRPRRVVALRKDEGSNVFVERERVQLGEDFLLLVRDDASLVGQVLALLEEVARPGHETHRVLGGLPDGWVLISAVQVLTTPADPPSHLDLAALTPVVSSQLSIAGGLRLPGHLQKWSSLCPPEIRAVSQLENQLALTLTATRIDSEDTAVPLTWQGEHGVLIVDLAGQEIEDGDYELELAGRRGALQRSVLRMRSSDTPDRLRWTTGTRLAHDLSVPRGVLTASPLQERADAVVRGALAPQARRQLASGEIGKIWWVSESGSDSDVERIVFAAPDPESCVVTGKHRMIIPEVTGKSAYATVEGTCESCGLVKRYPAWHGKKSKRRDFQAEPAEPEAFRLPRELEAPAPARITRDHAFDALVHVGAGSRSSFVRIASQIEESTHNDQQALAVDAFRNDLELLGHVDVERNERNDILSWVVAPPCLAEAGDGTFFLTGAWSGTARELLAEAVGDAGGKFSYGNDPHGPTTWFIEQFDADQLLELVLALDLASVLPGGEDLSIVPRAGMALLEVLPPLSAVERSLLRIPLPGWGKVERFDVPASAWRSATNAEEPGAYRFTTGFRRRYGFRSASDVAAREVAMGSPELVKHLEARRTGRNLLAYYSGKQLLAVPPGAGLPGLYGRAAVLNSGLLPGVGQKTGARLYREVPQEFASRLATLFSA